MRIFLIIISLLMLCCIQKTKQHQDPFIHAKTIGDIVKIDDGLSKIISKEVKIEILADGLNWSEGPLWISDGEYLLFSDVPENKIFKWKEGEGKTTYLEPSGYTGSKARKGEPGSNGLLLDQDGSLVLCQHGDRRIAKMEAPLSSPKPQFSSLSTTFEGKKFNSPNDAVFHSNGDLYFTDPPYGLAGRMEDPTKEIPFQGVYKVTKAGETQLITNELSRPNGIALSPDETTLYVANSDRKHPVIMSYSLDENGLVSDGKVFFDTKYLMAEGVKGSPDGLKVSRLGHIFATGPGGVLVLSSDGRHLGTISTGEAISNCALDEDENYLYCTSDMYLVRVRLNIPTVTTAE